MAAVATSTPLFDLAWNSDWSISLTVSLVALFLLIAASIALWLFHWWWFTPLKNIEFDGADLGIGDQRISFKPNRRDQEIAYKIWVELSTRKIGLPIDLKHDVIVEVYDSWHSFFSITRELIKDVPVSKLKSESTRKIITLSVNLLNDGLRPHLTAWQARFRRWYEKQLATAADDIDPQSIQSNYPKFDELRIDIMAVNQRLIHYREKMRELVLGLSPESLTEAAPKKPSL
jgi:hypothetical protein